MKVLIYGDPHCTKKIKEFQNEWNEAVIKTFEEMYSLAVKENVDFAICTGDFFDKDVIEAKSVPLVNKVRSIMSSIKTYLLLGNHEIDSNENNILDALGDDMFVPVTKLSTIENILFIPYNVDLDTLDKEMFKDKIIVTHHDIYGSVLAGGKVKASFGYDPNMFNESCIVFNGHIHLRSRLGNVYNIGSLFSTQFGEISESANDDVPSYYIFEIDDLGNLKSTINIFPNRNSLQYVTCNAEDLQSKLVSYKDSKVVLRLTYSDNLDIESLDLPDNVLKVSKRMLVSNESLESTEIVKNSISIDIKEMISSYIDKDETVPKEDKDRLKGKCIDIIGG